MAYWRSRGSPLATMALVPAEVEVTHWDAPLLELPIQGAVRDYLIGKGVQPRVAAAKSETVTTPLTVTKRGGLAFARRM
jgi:hypothetical protein